MSDFIEFIKTRRSVRKYEKKDVSKEIADKLLEAVRWTPSWANTQCWEVVIVSDKDKREKIKEAMAPKNPATPAIVDAPLLFALCGKLGSAGYYNNKVTTKFGDWFMFDLGLATQNLVLAAHDMGLGTVIAGLFDHNEVKKILNVPDGYEVATLICAGYPAQNPKAPKRKEISEFTHYDFF